MQATISIFVNPGAGRAGNAVKMAGWLTTQLQQKNMPHVMYEQNWPTDLSACKEAWIIGGDGTVNYFLNKYRQINIPIAIFKGGTGNDIYWKLYGTLAGLDHLNHVLNAKSIPVDAAMCNNDIYLNSSGIGFDGQVLQSIKSIRWLGGHLGYLLLVVKNIFMYREPMLKVSAPALQVHEKLLLATVNNSSRTGGGFLTTPQASVSDGLLDMMLCKPLPILKRLRYLPLIQKGKHLGLSFINFLQVQEVLIECEKELYAQLDGELICSKKFHYKILPGYLQVRH